MVRAVDKADTIIIIIIIIIITEIYIAHYRIAPNAHYADAFQRSIISEAIYHFLRTAGVPYSLL